MCLNDYNSVKSKYEHIEFDMKIKISSSSNENSMDYESANLEEVYFDLGDFSFDSNGNLIVAYTNLSLTSPIYIYQVIKKRI